MSSIPGSPLTDQHRRDMDSALLILSNVDQQIENARRAGLDVSKQKQLADDLRAKIQQIKSVYFPGQ